MALRRLTEPTDESSSKPYLEDFFKSEGESILGIPYQVIEIVFVDKGCIIVTTHFSTFFFRSNGDCKNIKEALPLWVKDKGNKFSKYLVFVPEIGTYKGKPQIKGYLALDDELNSQWISKKQDSFGLSPCVIGETGDSILNPLLKKAK